MPIYEYRCDSCGFQKEYIQRMSDAKLTDCPECKKATFSKMVTAAGFQLKGGGWYVTDFKSGGNNTNASGGPKKAIDKQSEPSGSAEPAKAESAKSESPKTEASASASSTAPVSKPAASAATAPASSSGS